LNSRATIIRGFSPVSFHPEFKSKPLSPHPLFSSFVQAAFQNRLHTEAAIEQVTEAEAPTSLERVASAGEN